MPKITKAQFDLLCTDNITKKDYDAIISKIDIRFFEICRHIIPIGFWYDYVIAMILMIMAIVMKVLDILI